MHENPTKFIAIGGAHWDILGRAPINMALHDDVGGRIGRHIGGVAGPIAMKIGQSQMTNKANPITCAILCYAGKDELGDALISKLEEYNVQTQHIIRSHLPTDIYMGIEAPNGLIAAIADCHSLEAISTQAAEKLISISTPEDSLVIDCNLSTQALEILANKSYPARNLTLIPASPGKIERLRVFIHKRPAQIILNLREASLLCERQFDDTKIAAKTLLTLGFCAALVSDGANSASFADKSNLITQTPPQITVKRFTGAGDTLAAHFLLAQAQGESAENALNQALLKTSEFISHEDKDI